METWDGLPTGEVISRAPRQKGDSTTMSHRYGKVGADAVATKLACLQSIYTRPACWTDVTRADALQSFRTLPALYLTGAKLRADELRSNGHLTAVQLLSILALTRSLHISKGCTHGIASVTKSGMSHLDTSEARRPASLVALGPFPDLLPFLEPSLDGP